MKTDHSGLRMASHHFQRTVGFLSCRRKAAKAAEIADRVAVVEMAAVAVGIGVEAAVAGVVAVAEDVDGIAC